MMTKIKIMLDEEKKPQIKDGYASFVKDVGSSGNKTRPKFEEHVAIANLVKKLRGDDTDPTLAVSVHDHGEMCDCPECSKMGIMDKIVQKFYG